VSVGAAIAVVLVGAAAAVVSVGAATAAVGLVDAAGAVVAGVSPPQAVSSRGSITSKLIQLSGLRVLLFK
jgi:hypothetical protein